MADLSETDLRAAVANSIISEAQAASLQALVHARHGFRSELSREDEPFEFFRGFSEIFITVGLVLLFTGMMLLASEIENVTAVSVFAAALSAGMAHYFTLRRRMIMPSMFLTLTFSTALFGLLAGLLFDPIQQSETMLLVMSLIGLGVMIGWYRIFHLPFAAFVTGLWGLAVAFAIAALIEPSANGMLLAAMNDPFNLNTASAFSIATLVFGFVAFGFGMWFDMRDPHRVGRHSAVAFWLHLLAAPAIVHTIATSLFYNDHYILTAIALFLVSILALVVDRRSFLTAGIAYMGILLYMVFNGGDANGADSFSAAITTLLVLGAFITILGTWWGPIRAGLMRRLPGFPGKHRLPPYEGIVGDSE